MKNRKKLIMRLAAAIVTVTSILIFAPWEAAIYYFVPLPATVREQVDDAVDHGLAGIIVYAQKGGQKRSFMPAAGIIEIKKFLQTQRHSSKLPVLANYIMRQP